jgi:hypothetical protein
LRVSGILTSSVLDTTTISGAAGYNSIMWKGTLGGVGLNEGKVRFQLSAAAAATGPWNFYGGSTCGALDWFDTTGPDSPVELKGPGCITALNNLRYYRYKVQVCSKDCVNSGTSSPIVSSVIVNWSP